MTLDLDDIFKEHVAAYESHTDKLETLIWKRPGSSMYAIYYVRWGGTLMVFGDCYCATYQWCPDGTEGTTFMQWIAERTNLYYFSSKCVAQPRDGLYSWSEAKARETIQGVIRDIEEAEEETGGESDIREAFEGADGWSYMDTEAEWTRWLDDNGCTIFGNDYWDSCSITHPGRVLNPCIRLHHEGLKRAMAQVKAREEAKAKEVVQLVFPDSGRHNIEVFADGKMIAYSHGAGVGKGMKEYQEAYQLLLNRISARAISLEQIEAMMKLISEPEA